ncbi:hypothetical protein BKA57DRAFT_511655 [Linnemannia elongata]|nr:hypothetical protein BKA57DRAFT_511655 [Linnemannia elongata]
MSLFKSNKNKTASAATTPAQTPRASLNEQRPETKMTQEQAIKMAMKKTVQANKLQHLVHLVQLGHKDGLPQGRSPSRPASHTPTLCISSSHLFIIPHPAFSIL